jgi:hypothetical protein
VTAREPMESAMFPASEVAAGRAAMPEPDALVEALADALTSCLVRLDDLGEGDGPTAEYARATLRRAGR